MATKLCCIAEEEGRSASPDLPNVVVRPSPRAQRLLSPPVESPNSRFTSARTEDLHELRQIFDNAKDAPAPKPTKGRFPRPSARNLHSLHKMRSVQKLIRKLSRDLSKKPSLPYVESHIAKNAKAESTDTVVKQVRQGRNNQLGLAKENLKRDLLNDRRPEEGGYDSDAEVLQDIARNIEKKPASKRPSIHSIEWSSPVTTRTTPIPAGKRPVQQNVNFIQPYQIKRSRSASLAARFANVFSFPNLAADSLKGHERKLRRSYSAGSLNVPELMPFSPLRLPDFAANGTDGLPWSTAVAESLRLYQYPSAIHSLRGSVERVPGSRMASRIFTEETLKTNQTHQMSKIEGERYPLVEVRVPEQKPTTPRPSMSLKNLCQAGKENRPSERDSMDASRQSLHLYSMRISHHLRSGSLLSWEQLAEPLAPPNCLRDRSISDISNLPRLRTVRHEKTSSSGFTSSKVPSKWGRVVADDLHEDKSSIYSSRPHSRLASFGGSMIDISRSRIKRNASVRSSPDIESRQAGAFPVDDDETPRPRRQPISTLRHVLSLPSHKRPLEDSKRQERASSGESSKKSKFREEFSPRPPKRALTPSESIMRFLNLKRNGGHNRSATDASAPDVPAVDGSLESREGKFSHSASIETEKLALGNDKDASPMWEDALKQYQDERAALFLPKNRALATHSSPLRERSASATKAFDQPVAQNLHTVNRHSAPLLESLQTEGPLTSGSSHARRRAVLLTNSDDAEADQGLRMCFDEQKDTSETLGAWGRYPSHTRHERTSSAGPADHVDPRDFALEAAVKFAMGKTATFDEGIEPTARAPSPPLGPGQKRRKKRIGNARVAKSHSMTFGKALLKNYTKLFRSQSIEFHRYGHGHRSSVSGGGTLDHPELEMLPHISSDHALDTLDMERRSSYPQISHVEPSTEDNIEPAQREQSTSTLRPPVRKWTDRVPNLDGPVEGRQTEHTAQILSALYEDCLPAYPRTSTDTFAFEDSNGLTRRSYEKKRSSLHSQLVMAPSVKHSRHASHVSRQSAMSNGSKPLSFVSSGDDRLAEQASVVSVRHSTMDLISLYKKQEDTERQKVLSLMRGESQKDYSGLMGL